MDGAGTLSSTNLPAPSCLLAGVCLRLSCRQVQALCTPWSRLQIETEMPQAVQKRPSAIRQQLSLELRTSVVTTWLSRTSYRGELHRLKCSDELFVRVASSFEALQAHVRQSFQGWNLMTADLYASSEGGIVKQ